jgi:hypothetical protein
VPFINHIDLFTAFLLSRTCDVVATKIPPDQIAEAQRMAREWKPKRCTGSAG